jgi:hypothetical protein
MSSWLPSWGGSSQKDATKPEDAPFTDRGVQDTKLMEKKVKSHDDHPRNNFFAVRLVIPHLLEALKLLSTDQLERIANKEEKDIVKTKTEASAKYARKYRLEEGDLLRLAVLATALKRAGETNPTAGLEKLSSLLIVSARKVLSDAPDTTLKEWTAYIHFDGQTLAAERAGKAEAIQEEYGADRPVQIGDKVTVLVGLYSQRQGTVTEIQMNPPVLKHKKANNSQDLKEDISKQTLVRTRAKDPWIKVRLMNPGNMFPVKIEHNNYTVVPDFAPGFMLAPDTRTFFKDLVITQTFAELNSLSFTKWDTGKSTNIDKHSTLKCSSTKGAELDELAFFNNDAGRRTSSKKGGARRIPYHAWKHANFFVSDVMQELMNLQGNQAKFITKSYVKFYMFFLHTTERHENADCDGPQAGGAYTFIVEGVLAHRQRRGKPTEYKIKWKGYNDPADDSWETEHAINWEQEEDNEILYNYQQTHGLKSSGEHAEEEEVVFRNHNVKSMPSDIRKFVEMWVTASTEARETCHPRPLAPRRATMTRSGVPVADPTSKRKAKAARGLFSNLASAPPPPFNTIENTFVGYGTGLQLFETVYDWFKTVTYEDMDPYRPFQTRERGMTGNDVYKLEDDKWEALALVMGAPKPDPEDSATYEINKLKATNKTVPEKMKGMQVAECEDDNYKNILPEDEFNDIFDEDDILTDLFRMHHVSDMNNEPDKFPWWKNGSYATVPESFTLQPPEKVGNVSQLNVPDTKVDMSVKRNIWDWQYIQLTGDGYMLLFDFLRAFIQRFWVDIGLPVQDATGANAKANLWMSKKTVNLTLPKMFALAYAYICRRQEEHFYRVKVGLPSYTIYQTKGDDADGTGAETSNYLPYFLRHSNQSILDLEIKFGVIQKSQLNLQKQGVGGQADLFCSACERGTTTFYGWTIMPFAYTSPGATPEEGNHTGRCVVTVQSKLRKLGITDADMKNPMWLQWIGTWQSAQRQLDAYKEDMAIRSNRGDSSYDFVEVRTIFLGGGDSFFGCFTSNTLFFYSAVLLACAHTVHHNCPQEAGGVVRPRSRTTVPSKGAVRGRTKSKVGIPCTRGQERRLGTVWLDVRVGGHERRCDYNDGYVEECLFCACIVGLHGVENCGSGNQQSAGAKHSYASYTSCKGRIVREEPRSVQTEQGWKDGTAH